MKKLTANYLKNDCIDGRSCLFHILNIISGLLSWKIKKNIYFNFLKFVKVWL